uniref:Uncharacterized protein n=1 Tax=Steinernema glaseri TaxID=37863 RepID=A0A1I7ZE78_9BILA
MPRTQQMKFDPWMDRTTLFHTCGAASRDFKYYRSVLQNNWHDKNYINFVGNGTISHRIVASALNSKMACFQQRLITR